MLPLSDAIDVVSDAHLRERLYNEYHRLLSLIRPGSSTNCEITLHEPSLILQKWGLCHVMITSDDLWICGTNPWLRLSEVIEEVSDAHLRKRLQDEFEELQEWGLCCVLEVVEEDMWEYGRLHPLILFPDEMDKVSDAHLRKRLQDEFDELTKWVEEEMEYHKSSEWLDHVRNWWNKPR